MEQPNDIPKYRKKSKSSRSNSKRRSNHKHQYEKIAYRGGMFGFEWGKRCSVCGRIEPYYSYCSVLNFEGLRAAENGLYWRPLKAEEIRDRFPGVDIYDRAEDGSFVKLDI